MSHPGRAQLARNHVAGRQTTGFTLVEALVSITITALAGSVLLLAAESSIRTARDDVDRMIAEGLAQQLIDEVLGTRYMAIGASPYQYPLGPSAAELAAKRRAAYDDTDDFYQFLAEPAQDRWARALGQGDGKGGLRHPDFRAGSKRLVSWRQEIEVYYVSESNLSQRLTGSSTSNFRAVEARISRRQPDGSLRPLAQVRRVYAYLPSP